ncbi:tetratricopeptide repeat protein [Exilibacterium tricleocarpae]|uniref:Tetratricopeptide repeat protein n=1 Tax=Exilibacterium tricleocarpae TaxID=2591008 RepID=A0A545U3V2_9GAMM|nr:tetratricopeptide repeat protein [Exilibacterium tricleocarpae]TQV84093.1 tetratricopeptide repeat protein [Exilibacterium tricleocarpae]
MSRFLKTGVVVLMAATIAVLLGACSSMPSVAELEALPMPQPSHQQLERVLSGRGLVDDTDAVILPAEDVFALSEPMREFLERYVSRRAGDGTKLRQLLQAIFHKGVLGLEYDPFKTYTAGDTFLNQEGNCLSFTLMFVAMARALSIDVYINEVDVPPIWEMQDRDTFVFYKHVNAVVNLKRGESKVVDLNLEDYDVNYRQRRISDRLATAQYYNNRGVQFFYQDEFPEAFRHLRKAIELEPDVSYLWGSLGSLYRRAGLLREAEIAYLQALRLSHRDFVALSNLGRVYTQLGEPDKAGQFHRLAKSFRETNPYYRYNQAKEAFDAGDPEAALALVKDAIRRYRKEHRFHHLAAVIHYRLGNMKQARSSLKYAAKVALDESVSGRYRHKLDKLVAASGS